MQSKRQCRRSAFFRHFAEPLQECNGIFHSCHLLFFCSLSWCCMLYIYTRCYRDVWHLCIVKRGERSGCLWFVALTFSSSFTFYTSFTIYFVSNWLISFVFFFFLLLSQLFPTVILPFYLHNTWVYFTDLAKLMISLLQNMQANDQRSTMLQLVDKMKIKQKELGWFVFYSFYTLYLSG